jgi:histidinol dehydrogenase
MERIRMTTADPADAAARVRALIPAGGSVAGAVAEIVAAVREGGDAALLEHERRFGGGTLPLRVAPDELQAALEQLDPAVRSGLETARANVGRVAAAGIGEDVDVALPEGQRVRLREVPVRRAAVYAPGGRAPYPSSVVMGAVTARAAGVGSVVVATPGPPVILAACAICCVGPGNLFVQEAKRQVSDHVGIDGFAGPSELVVIATAGADATPVALDLLAQAEHGDDSLVVAVSDDDDLLAAIEQELAVGRPTVADGPKVLVAADGPEAALAFAEALAPEHLQLIGEAAEALAPRVTRAGCLFVGAESATAFGDYVAGSNHTLPTGGAARFASGLSARHFRRRMSEVRVGAAADALAAAGVPIAEAEGFAVHAQSMRARIRDNPPR